MAKIKTRDAVKGTIKAIDKAAVASERMKAAYAKTKEKAEQGYYAEENSATEYAADKISHTADRVKDEGIHQFNKQGQKSVQTTKENIIKAKEKVADFKEKRAAKTAEKQKAQSAAERNGSQPHHGAASRSPAPDTPANAGKKAKSRFIKTRQQGQQTIKTTARNAEKTMKSTAQGMVKTKEASRAAAKGTVKSKDAARAAAKGTIKSKEAVKATAKGTVKTAEKGVKTAQATSKAAIKTTEQTAKAAKTAAKTSVKTAQKAAQAAKATAKATAHAIKVAVKATLAAIKAIIAGTKALIAAIMAGGWIAVAVILIICLIGLLVGSVFGIFFSGEDSGNGMTMQTVVREINADYDSRLDEIIDGTSHDVLEMSGSRAVWKEVLAVYSVKTTTDPDNPQEVATMDDNKKQLLKDIFWEMNEISSRTESKTETQITESDDGHGNIVETETTVTQTYLYITVSHKTAEEMADRYGFNEEQRQQLSELLAEENNSLWSAVLYGITIGDGEIVTVALSQVGNAGGEPYWSWYGFDGRVEWCACFVSWCADQCGYIDSGVIPKFAGCVNGSQWFKDRGQWQDGGFTPEAGQIIFFDWEGDGETDHVGIVERCENGIVYTVEGNSRDACRQRSYPVGSSSIYGYGIPAY